MTINTAQRLRKCSFEEPDSGFGFTHVSHPDQQVGSVTVFYPPQEAGWSESEAFAAMQGYGTKQGVELAEDGALMWTPPRHSTKGTELLFYIFGAGNWPFGEE